METSFQSTHFNRAHTLTNKYTHTTSRGHSDGPTTLLPKTLASGHTTASEANGPNKIAQVSNTVYKDTVAAARQTVSIEANTLAE